MGNPILGHKEGHGTPKVNEISCGVPAKSARPSSSFFFSLLWEKYRVGVEFSPFLDPHPTLR